MAFKNSLFYQILKKVHWHYVACTKEVADIVVDHRMEKRLNVETSGNVYEKEERNVNQDETFYMPTSYRDLRMIFKHLQPGEKDVVADLGSGKGRVVFYAATHRLQKVYGVELRKSVHETAVKNLDAAAHLMSPVELLHDDVLKINVDDITVFYMFNPFGLMTTRSFVEKVKESVNNFPRKVRFVYYHTGQFDTKSYLDNVSWLTGGEQRLHPERNIFIYTNRS
jgi:cyclopropane fatty-acyl-phospholipid synthase-like methyltransferase